MDTCGPTRDLLGTRLIFTQCVEQQKARVVEQLQASSHDMTRMGASRVAFATKLSEMTMPFGSHTLCRKPTLPLSLT